MNARPRGEISKARKVVTITNCNIVGIGTSRIASCERHAFAPMIYGPSDFFSRELFNVHAGHAARNALTSSVHKSRFAKLLSRSIKAGLFDIVENDMTKKAQLRVDDLVRVICSDGSLGPTLYMVTWLGEGPYKTRCCIREAGKALAGDQEFDTSLLKKVERDGPKTIINAKTGKPVTRAEVAARFE